MPTYQKASPEPTSGSKVASPEPDLDQKEDILIFIPYSTETLSKYFIDVKFHGVLTLDRSGCLV